MYPTARQKRKLERQLELLRLVYNKQLEHMIRQYAKEGKSVSYYDLNAHLLQLKNHFPELKELHSQVLQNVNLRVAWAFKHFFRRVRNKEKPGFPRFKARNRCKSLTYPQSGFSLDQKLFLSKIGDISFVKHRKVDGKVKTVTIKKSPTGRWFAFLTVEKPLPQREKKPCGLIAIDMGLRHFYTDSRGMVVDNPRYLRKSEEKLSLAQRKHSKKKKGSKNRIKSRLRVAKNYERIANQRRDFLHKESRKLTNLHSHIAIERLNIKNMLKNRYLSKSISDASWQKFLLMLAYKAEEAGSKILEVDARGTSQQCICGNRVEKTLAVRIHRCDACGLIMDRDIMSALLIKQTALHDLPQEVREETLGEMKESFRQGTKNPVAVRLSSQMPRSLL
ncbi:IS200/IS605 family element transposase accessory protein TnpB [Candidatus Woesearchaeota archaeon]|nr:IS200/IS605 family element transposase accessory protein TnpB [Candidatus Woesearchaeota archaeon]